MVTADDGYIYVRNWDEFQHYKGRRPAWIKSYLALLHDDAYLDLSWAQRGLLHGIWLLTAEMGNGRVPASSKALRRHLPTPNDAEARHYLRTFESLIHAGFIEVSARAEKEREVEKEKEKSSSEESASNGMVPGRVYHAAELAPIARAAKEAGQ